MSYLELAQAYAKACRERDMALAQLADIGAGYAEKMDEFERVIRCKDCKYWEKENIKGSAALCKAIDQFKFEHGYCSAAIRREDG